MPFTPTQSTQASNAAFVPVTVNIPMDVEIEDPVTKAVAAAQEQLHLAMEAQSRDLKHCNFAEEYWPQLRAESKLVVISDKAGVVETMEEAVMMIEMRY